MLGIAQGGEGEVNRIVIHEGVLVADPGSLGINTGSRIGVQGVDLLELQDGFRVIALGGDHAHVVHSGVQIVVSIGSLRERHIAPLEVAAPHQAVGVLSFVVLSYEESGRALLPEAFEPVPLAVGSEVSLLGHEPIPFLPLGDALQGLLIVSGNNQLAVFIHVEERTAVAEHAAAQQAVAVAGQRPDVVDAVVVLVLLNLFHVLLELGPGPFAVLGQVIDLFVFDAGIFQNLLVEEDHFAGFLVSGQNAVNLSVLGHQVGNRGQPLRSGQVDGPGLGQSVGQGAAGEVRVNDDQAQLIGFAVVHHVGQLLGALLPAALVPRAVDDLDVVGLFEPVTIVIQLLGVLIGLSFTGGMILVILTPPVIDVNRLSAEIQAFDNGRISFGQFFRGGKAEACKRQDCCQNQSSDFLHTKKTSFFISLQKPPRGPV